MWTNSVTAYKWTFGQGLCIPAWVLTFSHTKGPVHGLLDRIVVVELCCNQYKQWLDAGAGSDDYTSFQYIMGSLPKTELPMKLAEPQCGQHL